MLAMPYFFLTQEKVASEIASDILIEPLSGTVFERKRAFLHAWCITPASAARHPSLGSALASLSPDCFDQHTWVQAAGLVHVGVKTGGISSHPKCMGLRVLLTAKIYDSVNVILLPMSKHHSSSFLKQKQLRTHHPARALTIGWTV